MKWDGLSLAITVINRPISFFAARNWKWNDRFNQCITAIAAIATILSIDLVIKELLAAAPQTHV